MKFDYIKKIKSTKIRRTAQQKLKWRKKLKLVFVHQNNEFIIFFTFPINRVYKYKFHC